MAMVIAPVLRFSVYFVYVLLVRARFGSESTIFDQTLGFPGEGPRPQKLPLSMREPVDLAKRRVSFAAAERRSFLLKNFGEWLDDKHAVDIFELLKEEGI